MPTEIAMLLVREIMDCKPGKVRPLAEKFLQGTTGEDAKEFEKILAGDHDRIDSGRCEIDKIEA